MGETIITYETGALLREPSAASGTTPSTRVSPLALATKRAIDIVVSGLLLVLLAPLFVLIALLVKRDSPGPVFFRQRRLGLHMREFTILKFRTMKVGTSDALHRDFIRRMMAGEVTGNGRGLFKLEHDEAVSRFCRRLRRSSLDELPQLINVFRGEMSLVGPRPCLAYEIEHFEPHHHERFLVPAGMTGLWQVTKRGRVTLWEALELDVRYARAFSLRQDLVILARTPLQVLRLNGTE
jgi:lipopolysaccharide/colanic/teichoic acid biosynthesis glycosyltransferase